MSVCCLYDLFFHSYWYSYSADLGLVVAISSFCSTEFCAGLDSRKVMSLSYMLLYIPLLHCIYHVSSLPLCRCARLNWPDSGPMP